MFINTARCLVESNGTFAPVAAKPSMNALIPSITIVTSAQSKFAKFYRLTVKVAVSEALAALADWHTILSSVSFGLLVTEHNRFIMPRCKRFSPKKYLLMRCGRLCKKTEAMPPR